MTRDAGPAPAATGDAADRGSVLARIVASVDHITVRVRDRHILADTSWQLREGEQWAVIGPNGSGKSSLVRALAGLAPTSAGAVEVNLEGGRDAIGHVSFELQEALIRREDDRCLMGATTPDGGLSARELLFDGTDAAAAASLAAFFEVEALLDRPVRVLSTGEMRRALIARALARLPRLLILDEPFDGLDASSRAALRERLGALARSGTQMVLVVHRLDEILPEITHAVLVRDCRVEEMGPREHVLTQERLLHLYAKPGPPGGDATALMPSARKSPALSHPAPAAAEPLVEMRGITVRYRDTVVLAGLNWVMRRHENWGILGPNGCGKTTLLALIYGDNLQAYSNDVRLFGRRRGSGESLWEIRGRIGIVSAALQIGYRRPLTVREVVESGFFDSIGLYRHPAEAQAAAADGWIARLGISPLAERPFDQLSFGERRMSLVARAMVKSPELLLLDEPCEGLDPSNRKAVLALIDRIGFESETSILYVSHLEDELPRCLTHTLRLDGKAERFGRE